jgi:hypothetical protein
MQNVINHCYLPTVETSTNDSQRKVIAVINGYLQIEKKLPRGYLQLE